MALMASAKRTRALVLLTGVFVALAVSAGTASAGAGEADRFSAAFSSFDKNSSSSLNDSRSPPAIAPESDAAVMKDRFTAAFAPFLKKAVKTVMFRPPRRDAPQKPVIKGAVGASLDGKSLRYLIGAKSAGEGSDDAVTVVSYDATKPAKRGISVGYCNLFDETNSGDYGPYLEQSDTAAKYDEGQIDPSGPGWEKNLREQFERRRKQGFEYIELDNPDAYSAGDVIDAIELAGEYGLKVIAKNPGLIDEPLAYVQHPNVYGIIVERNAGTPEDMDALRRKAGKPDMPVWFVSFGKGRKWAERMAESAKDYAGMGVTYSSKGEYGNVVDILSPEAETQLARKQTRSGEEIQ